MNDDSNYKFKFVKIFQEYNQNNCQYDRLKRKQINDLFKKYCLRINKYLEYILN